MKNCRKYMEDQSEINSHNAKLMEAVFESVYNAMRNARGTRHTTNTSHYVDAERIENVVGEALRKAELDSLDAWRNNKAEDWWDE